MGGGGGKEWRMTPYPKDMKYQQAYAIFLTDVAE